MNGTSCLAICTVMAVACNCNFLNFKIIVLFFLIDFQYFFLVKMTWSRIIIYDRSDKVKYSLLRCQREETSDLFFFFFFLKAISPFKIIFTFKSFKALG